MIDIAPIEFYQFPEMMPEEKISRYDSIIFERIYCDRDENKKDEIPYTIC